MSVNNRNLRRVLAAVAIVAAIAAFSAGCAKEEPAAEQPRSNTQAESLVSKTQEAVGEAKMQVEEAILQTTCPVMGGAINKAIFVEYKGKKVYFCCNGCEAEFNKDPAKYVAKLPQFQQ